MTQKTVAEQLTMLQQEVTQTGNQLTRFWQLLTDAREEKDPRKMRGLQEEITQVVTSLLAIEQKLRLLREQIEQSQAIAPEEMRQVRDILRMLADVQEQSCQLAAYDASLAQADAGGGEQLLH